MGTPAVIAFEYAEDKFKWIRVNYDGYPSHLGKILKKSYSTSDKIKALLELGDLSSLGNQLAPAKGQEHSFAKPAHDVTIAYHRDRGEKFEDVKAVTSSSFEELIREAKSSADYIYIFGPPQFEWRYAKLKGNIEKDSLILVESVGSLLAEYAFVSEAAKAMTSGNSPRQFAAALNKELKKTGYNAGHISYGQQNEFTYEGPPVDAAPLNAAIVKAAAKLGRKVKVKKNREFSDREVFYFDITLIESKNDDEIVIHEAAFASSFTPTDFSKAKRLYEKLADALAKEDLDKSDLMGRGLNQIKKGLSAKAIDAINSSMTGDEFIKSLKGIKPITESHEIDEVQSNINKILELFKDVKSSVRRLDIHLYNRWKAGGFIVDPDVHSMYPSIEDVSEALIEED